jgi:hypothetical protein
MMSRSIIIGLIIIMLYVCVCVLSVSVCVCVVCLCNDFSFLLPINNNHTQILSVEFLISAKTVL